MRAGGFTDSGYRYRSNHWYRTDSYIPGIKTEIDKFYDFKIYNNDLFLVGNDYTIVAEMYFRLDVD